MRNLFFVTMHYKSGLSITTDAVYISLWYSYLFFMVEVDVIDITVGRKRRVFSTSDGDIQPESCQKFSLPLFEKSTMA